ncbi:protein disulfide isomerase-like 5-2 [Dendrobium catenatum]|uniref:Protein disulfide isomerase-like 5-2 n=1 Tax=Dendrobium catenatum TaxID=906689 RepID=A0A2I0W595_9ASPA|nr:protein disulfide isomerase-like 5-2 [Dendrobium catenatum]PKU70832.1 Protein disulfide isomerase-like 5-2 [Dendrobium catenatum]
MATKERMAVAVKSLIILFWARAWSFDFRPAAAHQLTADGTVIELNDSNFDSALSSFDHILVDFYAPWCGHCKRLSPVLDAVAPVLANLNQPIVIAKIDADKYRKLASKHEIDGFPTLKLFVHGIPIEYTGPRKPELLIRFLKKYVAPDVSVLKSDSAVYNFVDEAGKHFPIFIGFGLDESLIAEYGKRYKQKAWFAVADDVSEEVMVAYDFDKIPALVAIHPSYNEQSVFYGPFEGDFLEDFIRQNQLPLVVPIKSETLKLLNNDERKVVLTIVDDELNEKSLKLIKILRSAATANRDLVFAYVGVKQWEDFVDTFDVKKNTKLPKVLVWDRNDEYQLVEGSESLDDFEDQRSQLSLFLEGFREGRTIKKGISGPSFIGFINSLVGMKTVYLIVFLVAFLMVIQKLAKQGDEVRYRRETQSEAQDVKAPSKSTEQRDYQPSDKED